MGLARSIATSCRSSSRRGSPDLFFSSGLLVLPVWYGLRNYLSDMSESGALAGALACSFIGFVMNKLVLSQKENHMLIFSLLAIVIVLNYELAETSFTSHEAINRCGTHITAQGVFHPASGRAKRTRPASIKARTSIGDCLRDLLPWKYQRRGTHAASGRRVLFSRWIGGSGRSRRHEHGEAIGCASQHSANGHRLHRAGL